MKKLLLYSFLFTATLSPCIKQLSYKDMSDDSIEIIQLSDEQADIMNDIDQLLRNYFDFIAKHWNDVDAFEQLKTAYSEHQLTYNELLNHALSHLEPLILDNEEASALYNAIESIRKRAVFADVSVLNRLTVHGQSIFYGPVSINGSQLPANQPALSVTGTTVLSSTTISNLSNVFGRTIASPTLFVVINSSGMLGSAAGGGSGTVTSVTGSSNITVTNPTTSPVVSLNPNISLTSINASGTISAASLTANSATINGPLTATSMTITGASGDVGDLFTVGTGGLLSPAALVAGSGISVTPSAGTITIASSPLIINCDSGSAVESNNTLTFTGSPAGNTVTFNGSGSTVSLNIADSNGNMALGAGAQATGTGQLGQNTAIGALATATGGGALAIGYNASANGAPSIAIGAFETAGAQSLSIGIQSGLILDCFIGGIYGVAGTGSTVLATSSNQLIAPPSSRRYKENITPIPDITSEFMQLNPVKFNYIKDDTHTNYLGFIAEEVEPLFPEMIVRDKAGNTDALSSQFFTPLLVHVVQEHQNTLHALSKRYDQLTEKTREIKKIVATLVTAKK